MNIVSKIVSHIILIVFFLSCNELPSTEKIKDINKINESVLTENLKFTSAIRSIFHDSKGNYWIGSHKEGVCLYDGISFKYFTSREGLSDNQVRSITEDKNGNIWLGTANGISVYSNGFFTNYPSKNHTPIIDWSKTNGELWFYSWEEDGINRFDGSEMHYLIFPKPDNTTDKSFGVTGIKYDKNGSIWIATYSALYNYDNKAITVYDADKLNIRNNNRLHIRSLLVDSKNRIWIGDNGNGVLLKEGNSTINFSEKNNLLKSSISKNTDDQNITGTLEHPFAIEEDAEGNIWFGDVYTGAWKYNGKTIINYSITDKSSYSMIWTIYKDNNNNLFFGMDDGNIYQYINNTFEKFL